MAVAVVLLVAKSSKQFQKSTAVVERFHVRYKILDTIHRGNDAT